MAAWVRRKVCRYLEVRERGWRVARVGRWEMICRRISGGVLVRCSVERVVGDIWNVSVFWQD